MHRKKSGFSLVEVTAAMAVMIPVMIALMMAIQEVSQAFQIKQGLAQGARQAAHDMAALYDANPLIAKDRSAQNAQVFDRIKVQGAIAHNSQFDNATFDTSVEPPIVTVTVHYKSDGNTNLPAFPAFDPINLGSNIDLNASATYSLQ